MEPDESKGAFQYLTDAAGSAGVEVLLQGEMPEDDRAVELITAAGAEALTNAVRHAGAKQLLSLIHILMCIRDRCWRRLSAFL